MSVQIDPLRLKELELIPLEEGSHADPRRFCVMEAAAYIAGEGHTDHPACVSPAITAFMIRWNDSLPTDEDRNRLLKPLIPLIIGTRTTPEDEIARGFLAADWAVRTAAPAALRQTGSEDLIRHADILSALPPITDRDSATAANAYAARAAAARAAAYAAYAAFAARNSAYGNANAAAANANAAANAAADAAADAAAAYAAVEESAQDLIRRMADVGRVSAP